MQFKGAIRKFGETVTGTGTKGEWSKTSVLVEEINVQYPNSFVFEAFNKPLDGLAVGMIVTIEYNGRATDHNGKLYNSLLIYKIEKVKVPKSSVERDYGINPPNPIDDISEPDDMPF